MNGISESVLGYFLQVEYISYSIGRPFLRCIALPSLHFEKSLTTLIRKRLYVGRFEFIEASTTFIVHPVVYVPELYSCVSSHSLTTSSYWVGELHQMLGNLYGDRCTSPGWTHCAPTHPHLDHIPLYGIYEQQIVFRLCFSISMLGVALDIARLCFLFQDYDPPWLFPCLTRWRVTTDKCDRPPLPPTLLGTCRSPVYLSPRHFLFLSPLLKALHTFR